VARDEETVLAANRAFYDAFEKLDMNAMERVWSARAPISCVHPSGGVISGRDAVLSSWREIFQATSSMRFTLRGARVFVANDTAWVVLFEDMQARNGEAVVRATTQATNVFVREDGAWKLVHHHAEPAVASKPKPASPLN
jgi:ketosteroid isomerase-like protein